MKRCAILINPAKDILLRVIKPSYRNINKINESQLIDPMRSYVIGDIHGAHKALTQCLEKCSFDYSEDLLICLGDVCDGWPETAQCLEELLKIKNLIFILGNHDEWALEWMTTGSSEGTWLSQGGQQTKDSYTDGKVPEEHIQLLEGAKLYHKDEHNRLYVHAGINPNLPIEEQERKILLWDRQFFNQIKADIDQRPSVNYTSYSEIYLGHTPIHRYGYYEPIKVGEVWLMDTGAAWEGVLSIMDIETKKVFTSDPPVEMYPKGSGRF